MSMQCLFFCNAVPDNRVFEFSDYLFGMIITQAKKVIKQYYSPTTHTMLFLNCRRLLQAVKDTLMNY